MQWCFQAFQPPVKVSRIEPKQFYANERTFLTWLNMATTLGSISTALVAFGLSDPNHGGSVSVLAIVLGIVSIVFILYAGKSTSFPGPDAYLF